MEAQWRCSICTVIISCNTPRRKLGSRGTTGIILVIQGLVSTKYPGREMVLQEDKSYLCQPCFRKLESLVRLRSQLVEKERKMMDGIEKSVLCGVITLTENASPTRHTSPEPSSPPKVTTPRRHPVLVSPRTRTLGARRSTLLTPTRPTSRSPRKRQRVDTPTRIAIQAGSLQPKQSPGASVMVVEKKEKGAPSVRFLSKLWKKMGRNISRRDRVSLAWNVLKDVCIRKNVLNGLGKCIQKELADMCSRKKPSLLRQCQPERLQQFNWDLLRAELEERAPVLHKLLSMCVDVKRKKRPYKSTYRTSNAAALGICAATLLRHKNQHMNALQHIISLILHRGHAGKQVYRRLQRLLLCLSHQRTNTFLDVLGKQFDQDVKDWKHILEVSLGSQEDNPNIVEDAEVDATEEETQHCVDGNVDYIRHGELESECSGEDASAESETEYQVSNEERSESSEDISSVSSQTNSPSSSIDPDVFLGPEFSSTTPLLPTFKIVGDNNDKEVRPRNMRSDYQARSLHYFHSYAVKDCVNLDNCEDQPSAPDISSIDLEVLLPSDDDESTIRRNMGILIARTLKKHIPFFAEYGKGVERHIRHRFTEEMSQESTVVPLGVILRSEQKLEEMVDIMDDVHQYVPTHTTTGEYCTLGDDEPITVTLDNFHHILFGGDQMTAARARGSQRVRSNSERGKDRFEGLQPVVEDWHAKVCLLGVIWKRLYNTSSATDAGTLFHLRNLINRRDVVKNPTANVSACEDFFLHTVETHILSACMTAFGMSSIADTPSSSTFPSGDSLEQRHTLLSAIERVISSHMNFTLNSGGECDETPCDHVLEYARELLILGLLYMEFIDGVKEGDGERIIRCWRYFLLLFKATGRKNYSIEAFTLLAQYHFLYSERMRMQLMWSRTVNVHGRTGKNISCDLHMEHLNRECKCSIGSLGANITDTAIQRVGRSLRSSTQIIQNFDSINNITPSSGHHTVRSSEADMSKLMDTVHNTSKVFSHTPGRKHRNFPTFKSNIISTLTKSKLLEWCQERLEQLLTYK